MTTLVSEPATKPYRKKRDLYQEVTNQVIDLLESQMLTWYKPWVIIADDGKRAHNAFTMRTYSGLNQILLAFRQLKSGYPYNGWMTFHQIQMAKGQVLPGEKSTQVYFNQVVYYDKEGIRYESEQVRAMPEEEQEQLKLRKHFVLRYYNVFNVAQTSGLPDSYYEVEPLPTVLGTQKDKRAERLINLTDAKIIHKPSNEAYYNCLEDVICLPQREQFKGKVAYYETALHELAHWTGHSSRLNRKLQNAFGSEDYVKEELIAELCSAFLCAELGFSKVITNNAAYVKGWIGALKKDSRYILKAVRNAEKAADYIFSFMPQSKE